MLFGPPPPAGAFEIGAMLSGGRVPGRLNGRFLIFHR